MKVNVGVEPGLLSIWPTPSPPSPYIWVARSRGSGRVRYRLQYRHTIRTRISTSITIGPSLTGFRGTQLTGSIIYTLVNGAADALYRMGHLLTASAVSVCQPTWLQEVANSYETDTAAQDC
jgi:hypothetical protein